MNVSNSRSSLGFVNGVVLGAPAILANGVFWGLIGINEYFRFWRIVEPGDMIFLFIPMLAVPFVGLWYGLAVGLLLRQRYQLKQWFLHPGVQAMFQPIWFSVMMTGGCICAIPIVETSLMLKNLVS